ncbi:hypothetical protein Y032_0096g2941 [Ancylostoma ceylanicum]|uniref:Uncharacterized protein n=1 Tax=Ancylostoma ceylanicum TaxID=53326 RepID=A0A016TK79_9BILA|nr:hypothetical protein Y032_0096g2941 [Ancylostoma ceylanicum]
MINVFNSPIEASTIDEFAEGRSDEQPVFEKRKRRPKVEYTSDGRKVSLYPPLFFNYYKLHTTLHQPTPHFILSIPRTSNLIASETCPTQSLLTTCFRLFSSTGCPPRACRQHVRPTSDNLASLSTSSGQITCQHEKAKTSCQQALFRARFKCD